MTDLSYMINNEEHPCFGVVAATYKNYKLTDESYAGFERDDQKNPLSEKSIIRIASISKLVTVIGVLELVKEKKLNIDIDISYYFDEEIRNPNYPDHPITIRMLLSHTSSIRDGNQYNYPIDVNIISFLKKKEHWADESLRKIILDDREVIQDTNVSLKPSEYFFYSNLNYGIVATVMERVTGLRFDTLMYEKVFKRFNSPMSFNPSTFSNSDLDHIAGLYRRDNQGKWICQNSTKNLIKEYNDYIIGTNGSLFSPHGGLYTTLNGLKEIVNKIFSLKEDVIFKDFIEPVWKYDKEKKNGNNYWGLMNCYGSGIHILTGEDTDLLLPEDRNIYIGHSAEAYGLIGGIFLNLDKGNGIVYFITGTDMNIQNHLGEYSSFYIYEEMLFKRLSKYYT